MKKKPAVNKLLLQFVNLVTKMTFKKNKKQRCKFKQQTLSTNI